MNLNERDWAEFRVGDLFRLEPTKGIVSDDLIEGFDVPYIAAKHDDNGMAMYCSKDGFEDWISKGNCIIFINLGAGSAGYANYIKEDFIGMSGKTTCGYNDNLNEYNGTFIATILCQERPKYSFGRSWTGNRLKDTVIKLPVDSNGNPNWQFMEDYIKSLHYKPLTTKNKSGQAPALNVQDWGEFRVGDLFDITRGQRLIADDREQGKLSYFSASQENNGCTDYISNPLFVDKDALIYDTFGDCYYVSGEFTASDEISILHNVNMTEKSGLFIATIMSANKYKFAFGRKAFQNKFVDNIIKLPVDADGNPDWQFMEDYIKSLPYGDRLEG